MEPSAYEIEDLRSRFLQKLESEHGSIKGFFHPADMAKLVNSDDWLKRFLIHVDNDSKEALTMLWDTCQWRKDNKVNDITEQNVNMDYLEGGNIFVHNRDKDGKSLFVFKWKKHVKGNNDFEEVKRCVLYWFERVERMDKGDQITMFFDMADTGLGNVDMNYIKYLIDLCKSYYPNFLNNILIFEMPWILNAAFKVIKAWLPAKGVQKLKFVTKGSLKEYVSSDQALTCWGGQDDYVFRFVPESADLCNGKLEDSKKKVHFADGSPIADNNPAAFGDFKNDENSQSNSLLQVTPPDSIFFTQDGSSEMGGSVKITNISGSVVTYKIKTTSPEKFKVRPSMGVLTPNGSSTLSVIVQPGFSAHSLIRDKFLILSFSTEADNATAEVVDLWKHVDNRKINQHRLKCTLGGNAGSVHNGAAFGFSSPSNYDTDTDQKVAQLLSAVNHLTEYNEKVMVQISYNQMLQKITIFLIVFLGIMLYIAIAKLSTGSDSPRSSMLEHCAIPPPPPGGAYNPD